jgi:hypothetical protein
VKMVRLRINSVTMLYRIRNTINCRIHTPLFHCDASPPSPYTATYPAA